MKLWKSGEDKVGHRSEEGQHPDCPVVLHPQVTRLCRSPLWWALCLPQLHSLGVRKDRITFLSVRGWRPHATALAGWRLVRAAGCSWAGTWLLRAPGGQPCGPTWQKESKGKKEPMLVPASRATRRQSHPEGTSRRPRFTGEFWEHVQTALHGGPVFCFLSVHPPPLPGDEPLMSWQGVIQAAQEWM